MISIREAEEYLDRMEEIIPRILREEGLWAPYILEEKSEKGKYNKIPMNWRTGRYGDTTDPSLWDPYNVASEAFLDGIEAGRDYAGLGFLFVEGAGLFGIDLDSCRDPDSGEIEPEKKEIIDLMDTFTEVSISGTGFHIIGRGHLPDDMEIKDFEIYGGGRFFTVSAEVPDDFPIELMERQEELDELFRRYGKPKEPKPQSSESAPTRVEGTHAQPSRFARRITDEEVVAKLLRTRHAKRVHQLLEVGLGDDDDHSDTEFELARYILAVNGGDEEQTDRIIRNSILTREKWKEGRGNETYGSRTIRKAAESLAESNPLASRFLLSDMSKMDLTDNGNAHDLSRLLHKKLSWEPSRKGWRHFDKRHWEPVGQGKVLRLAREVLEERAKALLEMGSSDNEKLDRFVFSSLSAKSIKNAVELLKTMPLVIHEEDKFDKEPHVVNVMNGTLRLVKNANGIFETRLDDHSPHDRITYLAPVKFDPNAEGTLFREVVNQAFGGDQELIEFFQAAVGYSLLGNPEMEWVFFCHGPGGSMKTTILKAIRSAFNGYAMSMSFDSLLARKHPGGPRPDLIRLERAHMAIAAEAGRGQRIDAALLKLLSGGDGSAFRGMYKSDKEYQSKYTIWLAANDLPVLPHDDSGIRRRVLVIPFENPIPEDQQNPDIKAQLCDPKVSGPGILNWVIEGMVRYLNHRHGKNGKRFPIPKAVKLATEAYMSVTDSALAFVRQCCVEEDTLTPTQDLYDGYRDFVDRMSGLRALPMSAFVQRLQTMGYGRERTKHVRGIRGLAIVHRAGGRTTRSRLRVCDG